jgi:hypothetical protein
MTGNLRILAFLPDNFGFENDLFSMVMKKKRVRSDTLGTVGDRNIKEVD